MRLVETELEQPNLNLRVFKRSAKFLVLLWNRLPSIPNTKAVRITAKSINDGSKLEIVDFLLDPQNRTEVGDNLQLDPNMVVCVINEPVNQLDEKQNYYFTVEYPEVGIQQSIRVTRAGVLPPHEREDREKNNHNYLWDDKGQLWRKQCGVLVNGQFYAAIVVTPCPSCGHDGVKEQ